MSVRGHTATGDALELVAFDGKHFTLVSEKAYAPGQPLAVTLELDPPCTLDLKSIGSKRRDDGRFEVRARPATLTKAAREQVTAALSSH